MQLWDKAVKCYHAIMNVPHLTFSAKLIHRLNIGAGKTLWISLSGFNVIPTLSLRNTWYTVSWTYYPRLRQRWHHVISLTPQYQRYIYVVNLTKSFQRCRDVAHTTSIVYCELNLLFNIDEMLEQRWNLDVLATTSIQRWLLIWQRCDLKTQGCDNTSLKIQTLLFKISEKLHWKQTWSMVGRL